MASLKEKILHYYENNEQKVDIGFFLGGFLFDVFTLSEIDNLFGIGQQIFYLFITGLILYWEFLTPLQLVTIPKWLEKPWKYRQLIFHFILGSLLSVYSLFFLISSSFFNSLIFVIIIMGLMIANEVKSVQKSAVNIKLCLYVVCLFSFYSMMWPVLLRFVGLLPFILALASTAATLYWVYTILQKKIADPLFMRKKYIFPSFLTALLFVLFYFIGWIPPVPLSVKSMGVYHHIEKSNDSYILSHENPWWRFWKNGDQEFLAEPGDTIFFFARIFSPARFNDEVFLHWYFNQPKQGWMSTDRVKMNVTGGRSGGYRGFAVKKNYTEGEWKISVETTDGREIGRIYFEVKTATINPNRLFKQEIY